MVTTDNKLQPYTVCTVPYTPLHPSSCASWSVYTLRRVLFDLGICNVTDVYLLTRASAMGTGTSVPVLSVWPGHLWGVLSDLDICYVYFMTCLALLCVWTLARILPGHGVTFSSSSAQISSWLTFHLIRNRSIKNLIIPKKKDKDRRKGKCRRCCLGDRIYSIPGRAIAILH